MSKLVYFDYCAAILLLILLVSTIFRKMTKGRLNRLFLVMVAVSLIAVGADIWAINLDNMGVGNRTGKYITHVMYLFFHGLVPPLYIVYLVAQTDTWHRLYKSVWMKLLLLFPYGIVTMVMVLNFHFHNLFYLDARDTYTRGPLFFILYISAVYYIIMGIFYLCKYRQLFSKRRFSALMSLFPLMVVAVVIQYFRPEYVVEMFAQVSALTFISMMVQRPEEIIDTITGLGKFSAYTADMRRTFQNHKNIQIILINIINYQSLRDMLGYEGIDELLQKVAVLLEGINKSQHSNAELYYLGSGKFRFVIEESFFKRTELTAQTINEALKADFMLNGTEINLVSCVCVAKCPQDIQDVESLLAFGNDLNNQHYNGEVFYAAEIYKPDYYNLMKDINHILERAISEKKFEIYYQPIYSISEKRFNSAEALLRLKDEKYGFISPDIFIPAAEKSGSIHKIGHYVLEEVCRFISSEEFQRLDLDYIEVNLSVVQCMQSNLASEILELLGQYKVQPSQINLEITETAASYAQKTMMKNLDSLTKAGIQFSLDDFGTGYSNMRRIASMPFHLIKLDKTFTNLEQNPKMRIVLENTIRMIKDMNMKIVAEGIETECLVRQFAELHCEYIQGYYYSRPIPRPEFVTFIEQAMEQG